MLMSNIILLSARNHILLLLNLKIFFCKNHTKKYYKGSGATDWMYPFTTEKILNTQNATSIIRLITQGWEYYYFQPGSNEE